MESKVGFLGGMDRDSSLSKRNPDKYYDAQNIRVLTDDGLSTGSITNEKGNVLLFRLPNLLPATSNVSIISDFKIVGLGTMRDWVIVFTTGIGTAGNGQIWKCKYNKVTEVIEDLDINNTLNPSIHLVYNEVLGFDINYRVGEVVSRYQNDTNGKIYFIDGLNTMKHINILDPNSTSLPLSAINVVSDINLSQPKISDILIGGSLKSGTIQYSYQLFNIDGSESIFAPASGITHLTDKNDYSTNTSSYKGSASGTSAGKAVKVTVNNIDTKFDYIRLISIYYTSQEGSPEINIIEEKAVGIGYTEFIDDGTPIGVYSTSEYNSTGSRIFIPKTITTKNNYLVAANIKEEYFDVDSPVYYDSRAYRWNNGLSTFKIDGVELSNYNIVTETENCVLTRAEQELFKYNSNNGKLGGSGLNIEYEFLITPIKIDSDLNNLTSYTDKAGTNQLWSSLIDSTFVNNSSYTNYASPINRHQLVGYTRDEIYRFGIVFFDIKGRQSFAKWIADIKMPAIGDTWTDGFETMSFNPIVHTSEGVFANILGVKFTVNNLPANAVSYRIVRVRREQSDKYILGQGLMGVALSIEDSQISLYNHIGRLNTFTGDTIRNYNNGDGINNTYGNIIYFKSPEVMFTNSITPLQGDIVKPVLKTHEVSYSTNITKDYYVTKIKSYLPIISNYSGVVQDGIKGSDLWYSDNNLRYLVSNGGSRNSVQYHQNCNKGSSLILGLSNTIAGLPNSDDHLILNYTRDPLLIQYGGNTYADRVNNIYIACGNLNSSYVYGGDTYITMWEYLNSMNYTGNSGGLSDDEKTEIIYIPLETCINTELSNGTSFAKDNPDSNFCESVSLGKVYYPGNNKGDYPANYTDMYLYNTAYSAEPIGKTFSIKPQFFKNNAVNDYKVIVSEKHISGQLTDNWTKFLYNNMIEVNSAYGSINKIVTFRNRLFFFQDNAFGILGFEDRQLLNDNTGLPLVLGTGGILTNFQYISEKTGSKSKFGVVDSGSSLYFVDLNNRKFMKFDGNTDQCLSDANNMSSFFRTFNYSNCLVEDSTSNNIGIHGVFDPINKRVLYTMLGADNATFGYNEVMNGFESFYTFLPGIFENTDFGVISVDPNNKSDVYLHDNGLRGVFYGLPSTSYISHVFSHNPEVKKVFNNIEFNSYVEVNDVDVPLETITDIKLSDSFQTTNKISILHPNNIRRRFRTWRYQIPKVNSLRFTDYHLLTTLYFNNSDVVNKYFRLDDIIIHYVIPII